MSLILDALNKDGRERDHKDGVPNINASYGSGDGSSSNKRWLILLAVCVVVLLIAVIVLAVAWLRTSGSATPASAPASKEAEVQQAPVQRASTALKSQTSLPVRPEVEALYQPQQEEVKIIEPEVRAAVSEPAEPPRQTSIDEALARSLWEESRPKPLPDVVNQQVIRPKAAPVEAEVEQEQEQDSAAAARVENTLAAYADLPFLHELPQNLQDQIPTLMYARHSFDDGLVVLNKQRYGAGDAVAADVVLEQVMADGIVLSYAGRQFKLAALSSWVNY